MEIGPTGLPRDAGDSPRERLLRAGGEALSDAELLGLLLRGNPRASATELARDLLNDRGGLAGLLVAADQELVRPGIGRSKRAIVLAAVELGRRFARARIPRGDPLLHPEALAAYLALRYRRPGQEILGALYLDVHNRPVSEREVYRGTLYAMSVEPRAILEGALRCHALSIALFHSHPGGDPEPTEQDLAFTQRMIRAGEVLGIRLLDHLLFADDGQWVSLRRLHPW